MEMQAQAAASSIGTSLSKDEALKNAILAADLYMKAAEHASSDREIARLRTTCRQLLLRAETIKQSSQWISTVDQTLILKAPVSRRAISKREEIILLEGSKLHGFIFPHWKADPDDSIFEHKDGTQLYTDPTELRLSEAQKEIFAGWRRPRDYMPWPPENQDQDVNVDSFLMVPKNAIDLVQDITTDCSVVASLCAVAARASKGHGKLLASICYPYDESAARPRLSKNGKYIFRLHFNGCFRRVTIDDRLPASSSTRSLHVIDRQNPQLLWPALIEKAYLKVRGGYDFPGSNSGTDLLVLTGWIPEQIFLQSDDLQAEQLWTRIYKSFGYGDVMITLGTSKLSHKEERELGLAGEHDYAVLDMKETGPQRLLLVKNPWCDGMVWKRSHSISQGDHSEPLYASDTRDVIPGCPTTSIGTFWMSFEDVVQHFESLYLNWNPALFRFREDHHFSWNIPALRYPGSFVHNPQYVIESTDKGTVWVLLSRHFASGEHDIVKNTSSTLSGASSLLGFISLYLFEAGGRRVYLSDDAVHRGAYVDSPQTLVRLEVSPSTSYTLVVAQQGLPLPRYSFTLSFFSRFLLTVGVAKDSLSHCTTHTGSWNLRTAGGNASAPSYPLNPQFSISVPSTTDITLVLETDDEELAVHVKVVWGGGERVTTVTARDIVGGSGDYRRGCALANLKDVAAGKYTIVCSTFEAEQLGKFTLRVGSMVPCVVQPVLSETAGRLSERLPVLALQCGVDRMLAPLIITRLTRLRIVARLASGGRLNQSSKSRPLLRVSLEKDQGPNKTVLDVSRKGEFSDAPMGIRTADVDLTPDMGYQGGVWIVMERLGGRNSTDDIDVEVLSDSPVHVGLWGTGDG